MFEKFVYELYRRETGYKVSHDQITWQTDDGYYTALPRMQTDIVLHDEEFNKVIIDTKFYSNPMSKRFENAENKQLSHNLYQMFTYINNWTHHVNEQVGVSIADRKNLVRSLEPVSARHRAAQCG